MANIIVIIAFFLLCGIGIYLFSRGLSKQPQKTIEEQIGDTVNEANQVQKVSEIFQSLVKRDLALLDLTEEEYKEQEQTKNEILTDLDLAFKGVPLAKKHIKAHIRNMIMQGKTGVNSKNIGRIIHFDEPTKLTARDKFEICHHLYLREAEAEYRKLSKEEKLTAPSPSRTAMKKLIEENNFDIPIIDEDGEKRHIVTEEMFDAMYQNMMKKHTLSYNDKVDIVTQRIYAQFKGLSGADIFLDDSGIDEVDGGVSGIPESGYTFKMLPNMDYSWKHLWIVWGGQSILLKGGFFNSAEDLNRVTENIYQYNPPFALTEASGYVACSMADDTRIVVATKNFGEDTAFFARKHDTAKGYKPEQIITQEGAKDVIKLIKWLVKGKRNIIVSGEQATGKTTFLKMLFYYINETNIRVNEMMFELGLRYAFPDKNIFSMQATNTVSMQAGIDVSKKMNGGMNIIGEIAEAILTVYFAQVTQRGGSNAMATFHGKDTPSTINSMGQDLVECGVAKSLTEGKQKIAEILHINIHLDNDRPKIDITDTAQVEKELASETRKVRHIGFIDEVIPVIGKAYPYPHPKTQEEAWENEAEYYMRTTDREVFTINRLVEWRSNKLCICNIPSEKMCEDIIKYGNFSRQEEVEFRRDMEYLKTQIA